MRARTAGRHGHTSSAAWAVITASLVTGLASGCSTELRPESDIAYRAAGTCQSNTTHLPLPGVIVSYLLPRADSTGFHLYPLYQDTTDAAGRYHILLSFTISGALGFQKDGYRSEVRDICEACVRRSSGDDHELLLDVDLWPVASKVGIGR